MIDIVEGLRFSDSLLSVIHYPADYVLTLMKGGGESSKCGKRQRIMQHSDIAQYLLQALTKCRVVPPRRRIDAVRCLRRVLEDRAIEVVKLCCRFTPYGRYT